MQGVAMCPNEVAVSYSRPSHRTTAPPVALRRVGMIRNINSVEHLHFVKVKSNLKTILLIIQLQLHLLFGESHKFGNYLVFQLGNFLCEQKEDIV